MKKRLTIALVAHDNRKADLVEWAVHNAELLSHHHLVCTGTTGSLVKKAFEEKGIKNLMFEVDQELTSFEQVKTRLQSFVEML